MTSYGTGAEGAVHRELKRLALAWARAHRLVLAATEVRLPRSGYRADVVAATPRALSANALTQCLSARRERRAMDFLGVNLGEAGNCGRATGFIQHCSERVPP